MAARDGLAGSPGRDQLTHLRSRKPIQYGASGEDAIGNLEKGQGLRAQRVRSRASAIKARQRAFAAPAKDGLPVSPLPRGGVRHG
jgi:hypothetical protein